MRRAFWQHVMGNGLRASRRLAPPSPGKPRQAPRQPARTGSGRPGKKSFPRRAKAFDAVYTSPWAVCTDSTPPPPCPHLRSAVACRGLPWPLPFSLLNLNHPDHRRSTDNCRTRFPPTSPFSTLRLPLYFLHRCRGGPKVWTTLGAARGAAARRCRLSGQHFSTSSFCLLRCPSALPTWLAACA